MPYVRDVPPAGASAAELIRYYDREFEKLEAESKSVDAMLEAINIIGVSQAWFWDDTNLGDPGATFMRGNSNVMAAMTQINVSFENLAGKSIVQLLKTSTIDSGSTLGLINTSGLGSGLYTVNGPPVIGQTFAAIFVTAFAGQSGNPVNGDVMSLRWDFNAFPPQRVL